MCWTDDDYDDDDDNYGINIENLKIVSRSQSQLLNRLSGKHCVDIINTCMSVRNESRRTKD